MSTFRLSDQTSAELMTNPDKDKGSIVLADGQSIWKRFLFWTRREEKNVRGLLIEFWADREVLKIVDQSISCPLRPFGSSSNGST